MEIRILNHIDRNCDKYSNRIRGLGETVHVHTDNTYYMKKRDDYRYTGLNDNFFGLLKAHDWDKGRLLLMHDDLEFEDTLFKDIRHILQYAPDNPIAFFTPTNNLFKKVYESGKHVIKSYQDIWVPIVAYNKSYVDKFIAWCENNIIQYGKYSEDTWIWEFNVFMKECWYGICPSLTQHDGYDRSLHGNPAKCGINYRNSFCYESFDVSKIDWEKEFNDPYKSMGTSIKLEGLKQNYERKTI